MDDDKDKIFLSISLSHKMFKKALKRFTKNKKDKWSFANPLLTAGFIGLMLVIVAGFRTPLAKINNPTKVSSNVMEGEPQDTFPIPTGNPLQLFYLQRTANANTIVCELNYKSNGQLDEDNPVHVFWIRYAEDGKRKELNYIQRIFAYGINVHPLGNGTYKLNFVSYKKQSFLLMPSPKDKKYRVYTTYNKRQFILNRLFIKVDGGTFWSPNVVYMELKGTDPVTLKEVVERFKP